MSKIRRAAIQKEGDETTVEVEARLLPPIFGFLFLLTLFFLVHSFFDEFTGYQGSSFSIGFGSSNSRDGGRFVAKAVGLETTPYFVTMLTASLIQLGILLVFESQKLVITVRPRERCVSIVRRVLGALRFAREIPFTELRGVVGRERRTVLEYNGETLDLRHAELVPLEGRAIRFGQGLAPGELRTVVSTLRLALPVSDPAPPAPAGRLELALVLMGVSPILTALGALAVTALLGLTEPVGPAAPAPVVQANFAPSGAWWGLVEDARFGSYSAELTLYNAISGELSGAVRYSPFACRTVLRYTRTDGVAYHYSQQHESGTCAGPEPVVTLAYEEDGTLTWSSYDAEGTRRGKGIFHRNGPTATP